MKMSVKLLEVTPKMAENWLKKHRFEHQRNLLDSHIERLSREMENDRFIPGTQVHFGVHNGRLAILNGNHTLHAVVRSQTNIPLSILIAEVSSEEDLARLYSRHDIGRKRNWGATAKAADMYSQTDVPKSFVTNSMSALRIIMIGLNQPLKQDIEITHSRDLRIEAFGEYKEYLENYYIAISKGVSRNLKLFKRAAVMAVGLEILKYQPSMAYDFWDGASQDDGLRRNDPRKLLLDYLVNTPSYSGNYFDQIKAVALAWNAFFENRKLHALKTNAFTNFRLAGTPYRDGQRPQSLKCLSERKSRKKGCLGSQISESSSLFLELGERS